MFNQKKSLRDAYGEAIAALGSVDPDIVALDADLSGSTRTARFAAKYPDRFFNMGVSEQDMMSTAAGLAAAGKKPFASSFAVFATGRAWDQVRQSICLSRMNVKIVASHGGITVGEDGPTHQALEDIALMRVMPFMNVVVPADAHEVVAVVNAIARIDEPVYVRTSRDKFPLVLPEDCGFELGGGTILRQGEDVAIIACGYMVSQALLAAEQLSLDEGISAVVVNMSSIKPLDTGLVSKMASETGAIVTAEEHSITGGLGGAVAEHVCQTDPVPVVRVGMKAPVGQSGKPGELLDRYGMNSAGIVEAVHKAIALKKEPVHNAKTI